MTGKIGALTSLRFAAALSIMLYHLNGYFGVAPDRFSGAASGLAVSFFFVLSGFVLCFGYGLRGEFSWRRFIVARVARIYPAHLLVLGLLALLLWDDLCFMNKGWSGFSKLLLNLTLLQTWVPMTSLNSFNGVSWSLSTELGFYCLFPLILPFVKRYPVRAFAISFTVSLGLVLLCDITKLPYLSDTGLSIVSVVQNFPLVRLTEFVAGMCLCLLFNAKLYSWPRGLLVATLLEAGAIVITILGMTHSVALAGVLRPWLHLGDAGGFWLANSLIPLAAFGVLILVFSASAGLFSRILSLRPLVLLGEASYLMYLLHQFIYHYVHIHARGYADIPPIAILWMVWLFVFSLALFLYQYWESPVRGLINTTLGRANLAPFPDAGMAVALVPLFLVIAGLFLLKVFCLNSLNLVSDHEILVRSGKETPIVQNVVFGSEVRLAAGFLKKEEAGRILSLYWEACDGFETDAVIAVHLLDAAGKIKHQYDYKLSFNKRRLRPGQIWLDQVFLPPAADEASLGIVLLRPQGPIKVISGNVSADWDGYRLNIGLL
jgi:peptidoglycan/LPS O-acetylase OafA/YrhL